MWDRGSERGDKKKKRRGRVRRKEGREDGEVASVWK